MTRKGGEGSLQDHGVVPGSRMAFFYTRRSTTDAGAGAFGRVRCESATAGMEDCVMTSFGIRDGKFDTKCKRSGLTYQQENILYEAIQPGHPANPWGSKAQLRNCMIVNMLLATGMRRDELLSLKLPDIDLGQNMVAIRRISDTANDLRLYRSNVKRSRVFRING